MTERHGIGKLVDAIRLPNAVDDPARRWLRSRALVAVLSRDMLMSLASFAIDMGLFLVAGELGLRIVAATFAARSVSAVFNFLGCKYVVFRSTACGQFWREAAAYAALAALVAGLSAGLVELLHVHARMPSALCKLLVDGALYAVAFTVKRYSIFGTGRHAWPRRTARFAPQASREVP